MRRMNDTVTVWHKTRDPTLNRDVWARTVVDGCSWEVDIIRSVSGTTAAVASTFTVLTPPSAQIVPGDLVALGAVDTKITGAAPYTEAQVKVLLMPQVFTVKAVYDGTAAYKRAPHLEVTGV